MTAPAVRLRGVTWNHTRGYLPMVATAQRFSEIHPGVEITWEKRSLQEFGDASISRLTEKYDLLVIDHPFVGDAAAHGTLLPLDEYIPQSFLDDQACHSVGKSHESYSYGGHQWALAIDAATPVSSSRPDLLERNGVAHPETWDELIDLARRGVVALPAVPIDSLMNFYMVCLALGGELFSSANRVVHRDVGVPVLTMLRELLSFCPVESFTWNPIAIHEQMSSGDSIAYCPFAYGYSNYSRPGYARQLIQFGDLVCYGVKRKLCSTLGGTGLAISARCRNKEEAAEYVRFVGDGDCQRTIYFASGGQPGHRLAWEDPEVNKACNSFFERTLPALDRAYLRPRYDGYPDFQDSAGPVIQQYLQYGGNPSIVIEQLNHLYVESQHLAQRQEEKL